MKIIDDCSIWYVSVYKLKRTFLYMLYSILTILAFGILYNLTLMFFGYSFFPFEYNNILEDVLKTFDSEVELAFNILLFAPLTEEFIFRNHLKSLNENIPKSAFILLCLVMQFFTVSSVLFYTLCVYGLLILTLYFVLSTGHAKTTNMIKINIISSIVFFAFAHMANIEVFDIQFWPIYLHYLFHFLVIGYCLSIIRINLGIFYSVFSHFIFNMIVFAIVVEHDFSFLFKTSSCTLYAV